jgi:hypothetical protein
VRTPPLKNLSPTIQNALFKSRSEGPAIPASPPNPSLISYGEDPLGGHLTPANPANYDKSKTRVPVDRRCIYCLRMWSSRLTDSPSTIQLLR